MNARLSCFNLRQIPVLLRGDRGRILFWIQEPTASAIFQCCFIIILATGMFGAAVGFWRAPLQGFFAAIKSPLVLLITSVGNALLNAMLAPLLGLNIGFKQSFLIILLSFTIMAVILGSFSPIMLFIVWNAPPLAGQGESVFWAHSFILLSLVGIITLAGIAGNIRLFQLLRCLCNDNGIARRVMLAWLGGNLFFGSQVSWILRPFVGLPSLPVAFLRDKPLQGSFYETVFQTLTRFFS